ncbi:hypothetical protein AYL99_11913 [Fonsecaea erecta]|uniref:Uncharacterized protein n=1 Tax=Fonsecaea erecta TaxID=1367422 RepID=A0A178Z304_9EURO|nr:hypothetical protein AYL99_11913 [Fonsecaea erecta]OAP53891.1 hypothetical protein AYL99_11913 [Fonsecaea erecta]
MLICNIGWEIRDCISTTFAPPTVGSHRPSATLRLNLLSPPFRKPTCRLMMHALRTASRMLGLYQLVWARGQPALRAEEVDVLAIGGLVAVHDPRIAADDDVAGDVLAEDVGALGRRHALGQLHAQAGPTMLANSFQASRMSCGLVSCSTLVTLDKGRVDEEEKEEEGAEEEMPPFEEERPKEGSLPKCAENCSKTRAVGKIAEAKKKEAFLRSIEDRPDSDDGEDDLAPSQTPGEDDSRR